tara:strand:+ start:2021 stop:3733 length:1713 start_codon:yes stop_codon:yes gene_type:complete
MGLMRALQGVATGYLGASVDRMQANAEAKAAQKELEDKYKLEETLRINILNAEIAAEKQKIELDKKDKANTVKEILDAEGMSPELQIILSPYTKDMSTYSAYMKDNGYQGYGWFKEPVPFVGYEGTTIEQFIIDQNNKNKEFNKNKISQNLIEQGGVLNGRENTSKVLIPSSMAEEEVGIATTIESPFPASFDEITTDQLNIQQQLRTGPLVDESENIGFSGASIPFSKFNIKKVADVSNTERISRDNQIKTALAPYFESVTVTGSGDNAAVNVTNLKGFNVTRWNTLTSFATDIARVAEETDGEFLSPTELVNAALAREQEIQDIAAKHLNSQINPLFDLAVKANVVSRPDAFLYTVYEDITSMNNVELQFYFANLQNIDKSPEKKDSMDLITDIKSPEFQRPDGFDDIANRIDDAVIGSINLDFEDIYNDDGELIQKGKDFDEDDSIFTEGSAGALLEKDLFGERTTEPPPVDKEENIILNAPPKTIKGEGAGIKINPAYKEYFINLSKDSISNFQEEYDKLKKQEPIKKIKESEFAPANKINPDWTKWNNKIKEYKNFDKELKKYRG